MADSSTTTIRLAVEGHQGLTAALRSAANDVDALTQRAAGGVALTGQHIGNLTAQIQDIGVSLASGQSPFLVMLQQGSQISHALGNQGVRGALVGMKEAFLSLVSPANLLIAGVLGLGAAAVYAYQQFTTSGHDAEATLKEQERLVNLVKESFDRLSSTQQKLTTQSGAVVERDLLRNIASSATTISQERAKIFAELNKWDQGQWPGLYEFGRTALAVFDPTIESLRKLADAFRSGAISGREFEEQLATFIGRSDIGPRVRELAGLWYDQSKSVADAEVKYERMQATLHVFNGTATEAERALLGLSTAFRANANAISEWLDRIPDSESGKFRRLLDEVQHLRDMFRFGFPDFAERFKQWNEITANPNFFNAPAGSTGLNQFSGDLSNLIERMKEYEQLQSDVGEGARTFTTALSGIATGTSTVEDALKRLVQQLAELGLRMALLRPLENWATQALPGMFMPAGTTGGAGTGATAGGATGIPAAAAAAAVPEIVRAAMTRAPVRTVPAIPASAPVPAGQSWGTRFDDAFQPFKDQERFLNDDLKDALEGATNSSTALTESLQAGSTATQGFTNSVGQATSGLGSFVGSLFNSFLKPSAVADLVPGGWYHQGGVVGRDGEMSLFPASLFYGAPRFHRGLGSNEFPAILERGEMVIPRGARLTERVVERERVVVINHSPYLDARIDERSAQAGGGVASGMMSQAERDRRRRG